MKTHAKNAAVGGGLVPVILAAAVAIGNGSQQALNLHLQGIALAIYLVGFAIVAGGVTAVSLKVEGQKAIAGLTSPEGLDALAGIAKQLGLGDLFHVSGASKPAPSTPFPPASPSTAIEPPAPPSSS